MSEEARIRLAKAMGLPCHCGSALSQMPQSPPCKVHNLHDILGCPDPFTDANDDYAVLEFFEDNVAFQDSLNGHNVTSYTKGMFARAALKVIGAEAYDE